MISTTQTVRSTRDPRGAGGLRVAADRVQRAAVPKPCQHAAAPREQQRADPDGGRDAQPGGLFSVQQGGNEGGRAQLPAGLSATLEFRHATGVAPVSRLG
ncbi:hypothetical protein GCM10017771_00780 [Streptomyces capitiformicae]|uniref:Uncharacterized protein n=1 Tax=Streptomyces capitiformicae TaxID=2014920 RepID=A0A919GB19_9ACTN|nr:hypothetical protein GCM10017771_00780 [Streptomyces capitiformicae]